MTSERTNLATLTAIVGVLTLILSVSAFAEKAHGDHLPERNNRGIPEASVLPGIPLTILALFPVASGFSGSTSMSRHSIRTIAHKKSCCSNLLHQAVMSWHMRHAYF
ncbi:MAG: hypothetical protein LUQ71_01565 [Methanoregula sp.]|nr:hypothetical protein [Methanoregula sp.]